LAPIQQISGLLSRRGNHDTCTDTSNDARLAGTEPAPRLGRRRRAFRQTAADCILCRFDDTSVNTILIQSRRFYARHDNFPATAGHIEIVPKWHVVSFFELTPSEAREAFSLMVTAQQWLREQYKPDGFTIGINDGKAAGRSIDHLHIHIIPRYVGDVEDPRGGIRQVVPNCDPTAWLVAD
jgi:diadenosine tetraphosphate (Ap4A) HIT family hydrolase